MPHRAAQVAALAVAALGSACTTVHRCPVPTPVVEAAPGPRLPLGAEVRYLPAAVPAESREETGMGFFSGPTATVVDSAPPTRALFERLAASLFERTAPPADVVLEVRLDRFRVAGVPFYRPATSEVGYRATLRAAEGAEIASFDVAAVASVAPSFRYGSCGDRGEAVAVAMQGAGADLVRKVSESRALAVWLAGRGVAPVAFRVKGMHEYADPAAAASTATSTSTSTSKPFRPAEPGPPAPPLAPRSLRLRAGLAAFRPRAEDTSRTLSWTVFGAEARVAPGLRIDVDLDRYGGLEYQTAVGPASVARATFEGLTAGLGFRVSPPFWPRAPLEPWVGASVRLVSTKLDVLSWKGPIAGGELGTSWNVGADVGGGLAIFFAPPWFAGADVRWRFARARFAQLGSVDVGGLLVGGVIGAALPE